MDTVTWQGTEQELTRLRQAVDRHCRCIAGVYGLPPSPCAAHAMLSAQSTLDHLLYVYRTRRMFITREFYALPSKARKARVPGVTTR
jgi:hypothetical protein